jgi:hypothetical protein
VTLSFSKSTSNIAKVLPALDKIKEVLSSNAQESNYLPSIKAALMIRSNLLTHYYELTDVSDVYRIATSMSTNHSL